MKKKKPELTEAKAKVNVEAEVIKPKSYTSEYLNEKLADISDSEEYGFEAFGGKTIPYIGWHWRRVDFDRTDGYEFGILPITTGFDANDSPKIGFMGNNKWGYGYVKANAEQWAKIKDLLIEVVENPCKATLEKANIAIQALAL